MTDAAEFDYEALGLVAGLEIHQQLGTDAKLFCGCPTELRDPEAAARTFTRYLHPTKSELGEIDEAALEESRVDREFEYLAYDTTCLVEEDDEPPHRVDDEAMDTALEIAQLLDMDVADQVHVMRKIVVDGSNTTGFQRSMLVANDGEIQTDDGPVGIEDMMLEEESARRVEETEAGVRYSLDRLGIPLVEIGTKPDIRTPEQARERPSASGCCCVRRARSDGVWDYPSGRQRLRRRRRSYRTQGCPESRRHRRHRPQRGPSPGRTARYRRGTERARRRGR